MSQSFDQNHDALESALDYAGRGWPVLLLYERDGKLRPISRKKDGGPNWDATTDCDEIKRRFANNPNAGIGIATGKTSRLLVIDIDSVDGHGVDGTSSLMKLEAEHGPIPETLSASTPSGGRHLYFKYPENRIIKIGAGDIAEGVDHRGEGGFIVAPPSVRSDGKYQWENENKLAECPDWLLNLMEKLKPSDCAKSSTLPQNHDEQDWANSALSKELAELSGAPEGQRNHQLYTSAYSLGQIIGGGRLDRANVERELRAIAENIGLERNEIEATIKSGIEAGMEKPRTSPETARDFDELMTSAKELNSAEDTEEIAAIIAESKSLSPLNQDALLGSIKDATGLPLGSLRRQLALTREVDAKPDHLELAQTTLNIIGSENIIRADECTWKWSGTGVWRKFKDRSLKQVIQSNIYDKVAIFGPQINSVLDVLNTEIHRPDHEFNQGATESINCLNGELELKGDGWHLMPHVRKHYRTTQIPIAYDPNATAPRFEQFLDQIFLGDDDKAEKKTALLEMMGYSLMSHARHELFIMLIGSGANGKSVLLRVLENLCGLDNVASVQPSHFPNTFQRAYLHEKLANIVTELRQGEVIADAELKAITSGEPATVEHKHKDPFVMRPYATCWFGTNHMPHTRDFSYALFRRAVILQFNTIFKKNEQDPMLKDKLFQELPGILNLSINAYAIALRNGFTQPDSSKTAKSEWKLEADQVAQFVADECEVDSNSKVSIGDLFKAYQNWADENGIAMTVTKRTMRVRLTRLGFRDQRTSQARCVDGLRLRNGVFA